MSATKDYLKFAQLKVPTDLLDAIASLLDMKTVHGRKCLEVKLGEAKLLDDKQQDYGPNNIIEIGLHGVISRVNDKKARAENLLKKRTDALANAEVVSQTANESLADTFQDIANYGTIATMVERNIWPTAS